MDPGLEVYSAGTHPAAEVHPLAVRVMEEAGVPLTAASPKPVDPFLRRRFDYVITVCDDARGECPVFSGRVGRRLHIGFDDPARARGTPEEVLTVFRRVRDEIRTAMEQFVRERDGRRPSSAPDPRGRMPS